MSSFDCSLHIFEEAALARFVDRFLGRTSEKSAFDDVFPEADAMIADTEGDPRRADPAAAGRALGELALLYVSTEGPHAYQLDFSLSCWDEDSVGAPMPSEGLGTIEDLLGPIIDAYPAVRHQVPSFIFENNLLGPFVRARDVPAVLAYVEKVLDALVPGERRLYETLAKVLRAAAARGLAFWEATSIEVPQAHEEWLEAGPTASGALVTVPSPAQFGGGSVLAQAGDRYILYAHFETHFVDLSSFPPADRALPGFQTTAAAFTPWGTALLNSATDPTLRPYVFALYEVDLGDLTPRPLDLGVLWKLDDARPTPNGVLLFPRDANHLDARPSLLRDGRLTALDLPPAKRKEIHTNAQVVPFGDGSMLVIWNGEPYRLEGDEIVPLGGGDIAIIDLQSAATRPDGSIALSDKQVPVRMARDGARETILPLDNAQDLVSGPDDALIIREGLNVEGDALKIWWPGTREVTSVHPDFFGVEDVPMFVIYAATPRLLVFYDRKAWTAVPWSTIAALPRQPEAQFLAKHDKLVAKRDAKKKKSPR